MLLRKILVTVKAVYTHGHDLKAKLLELFIVRGQSKYLVSTPGAQVLSVEAEQDLALVSEVSKAHFAELSARGPEVWSFATSSERGHVSGVVWLMS